MIDLARRFGWYLAGIVLVLIVGGWLLWSFDPFGRRKAAEARADAAETQTAVTGAATQALDRYQTQTIVIREKADASIRDVQKAPGADAPLPPELRAAWLRGLDAEASDPSPR